MHPRPRTRSLAVLVAASALVLACTGDDSGLLDGPTTTMPGSPITPTAPPATRPTTTPDPDGPVPDPDLADATFVVRPGVEQLTITDATPGDELSVFDDSGSPVATARVDDAGAVLFRNLEPGGTFTVRNHDSTSPSVTTMTRSDHPDRAFFAEQRLVAPGFGYLTTRDGTTLSVNIRLPGPIEDGPYPTVVEYSGYSPSNPDARDIADVFVALGYAYAGVNMRGTGCSGGSYRFFEYAQSLDGYDAVEAIAAQPWVLHGHVGMVGVSYPGVSQLFVAQTRPPSLAAITPLSVLDDSYAATLYPGGILNTGFAVEWTSSRMTEARPSGQAWAADRITAGDEECAANQGLRLQNPDLVQEILANPFREAPLADELAPRHFVDQIEVPVFLAGAWQDEQTGGRFATMLDRFTAAPRVYASLVNGLHTESISPMILARMHEFLELYVARRTPQRGALDAIAPLLGEVIFGTSEVTLPAPRFAGMGFEEALAAFQSEPAIQVLFEQGAAQGAPPLAPMPRFVAAFERWPVPEARATAWYLGAGDDRHGALVADPAAVRPGTREYLALPDAIPATVFDGSSSAIWRTDVTYDWRQPPPGTAASFLSDPLPDDVVVVGSGSADLWIRSNLGDTDLEVTITEVRPDGGEVYVQSGWLRASHRALDERASTELRPVHTHRADDAEPLPDDRFEPVRVEVFPFAHVFRAGSRIRLTVDAPGGNRPTWSFDTIAGGEQVTVAHDRSHPSRLVLAVVEGVDVPRVAPECASLRGQPCRAFTD